MSFDEWFEGSKRKLKRRKNETEVEFIERICKKGWDACLSSSNDSVITTKYFAKIDSKRLDSRTSRPFVLLIDIRKEDGTLFRDHTWVQHSRRIGDKKGLIEFTAREEEYLSSGGIKKGLRHIRNVKEIR